MAREIRGKMTEPKSECCGAKVYKSISGMEYAKDGEPLNYRYTKFCSQCHEPTTVRKEEDL